MADTVPSNSLLETEPSAETYVQTQVSRASGQRRKRKLPSCQQASDYLTADTRSEKTPNPKSRKLRCRKSIRYNLSAEGCLCSRPGGRKSERAANASAVPEGTKPLRLARRRRRILGGIPGTRGLLSANGAAVDKGIAVACALRKEILCKRAGIVQGCRPWLCFVWRYEGWKIGDVAREMRR